MEGEKIVVTRQVRDFRWRLGDTVTYQSVIADGATRNPMEAEFNEFYEMSQKLRSYEELCASDWSG